MIMDAVVPPIRFILSTGLVNKIISSILSSDDCVTTFLFDIRNLPLCGVGTTIATIFNFKREAKGVCFFACFASGVDSVYPAILNTV